jgi:hypothetical protein
MISISPTSGPEGTRVEITGEILRVPPPFFSERLRPAASKSLTEKAQSSSGRNCLDPAFVPHQCEGFCAQRRSRHVNGGLYIRQPWFGGSDYHEPMPSRYNEAEHATVIFVGERADRIRVLRPALRFLLSTLEGCTAKARVKISPGALLQVGFDYWRNPTDG